MPDHNHTFYLKELTTSGCSLLVDSEGKNKTGLLVMTLKNCS